MDWRQIAKKKNLILKSGNQHAKHYEVTDLLFTKYRERREYFKTLYHIILDAIKIYTALICCGLYGYVQCRLERKNSTTSNSTTRCTLVTI